ARRDDLMALRIGVAGVGALGFHHARIARELEHVTMVGVHDANPDRLAYVTRELGVRGFPKLEALLDQVDACIIAVTTTAHERVALPALERGVHVLIEKPIAPTLEEADRIL